MSFESLLAFAGAFFVLALSPGPGLAAILSRSLGAGLRAGLAVTAGLVIGDLIFIAIAMVGLSAIANLFGPMFQLIKYAGAAYLLWLGIKTLRTAGRPMVIQAGASGGRIKDITLGLFVTLGNPKPILFYGALLPTFMDLTHATARDFGLLAAIVAAVSMLVYTGYIVLIERVRRKVAASSAGKRLNQATGVMLIGSGIALAGR